MLKLFSDNHLIVEKYDSMRMTKILSEWLDFTKTLPSIRGDITNRFSNNLEGGRKTGFKPCQTDNGICFDHKWTMIIGRKSSTIK